MSQSGTTPTDFFVAGGTLRFDAPSYIERPADTILRQYVEAGRLCYVLTTRQMGKSSLMNRISRALQNDGVGTVIIDLTAVGTATPDEWYLSLLDDLQYQLDLQTDVEEWWEAQEMLPPVKRFTKFFRDILLHEFAGQIAIFIDEVDSALHLSFSDDFFAAIRSIYNQTLTTDDAGRLSFVLLGVATPNELIKNQRRTPFNVGERVELEEIDIEAARLVFKKGLPEQNDVLIDRIFYWTGGHPYLTQRIGQAIARAKKNIQVDADVDDLVAKIFFGDRALVEESNLQFVNGRILSSPQKNKLLHLYQKVYRGKKPVVHDEHSAEQAELKLYGLVKNDEHGRIVVRNRIYRHVFDQNWIKQNRDLNKTPLLVALFLVIAILAIGTSLYFWQQSKRSNELLAETYITNFSGSENPSLKLGNLAQLIALGGYEDEAIQLFSDLPLAEKSSLFLVAPEGLEPQMELVVQTVASSLVAEQLDEVVANTAVLEAMVSALQSIERLDNPALLLEIESWVNGRKAALTQDYETAQIAYSVALSLNMDNPATRYERALVALAMQNDELAVDDLSQLLAYGDEWQNRVKQQLQNHPQLVEIIRTDLQTFANLIALLPTEPAVISSSQAAESSDIQLPTSTSETDSGMDFLISAQPAVLADASIDVAESLPQGRIIYTCFPEEVDQICVIDADGENQVQVTNVDTTSWVASFVPNADEIVFSGLRSGVFGLYQSDLSGESVRQVIVPVAGDYSPAYSPDGEQITFVRVESDDLNIWVMDKDGSNARPVVHTPGDSLSPVWSPDGQYLAYVQKVEGDNGYSLWVMNLGSEQAQKIQLPVENIGGRIDWSPNGRWLAFYAGEPNDYEIYLYVFADNTIHQLTFGGNNVGPAFSPDSAWITFSSTSDGDNEIYIMQLDGTNLTQLTDNDFTDWQPRWGSTE